VLENEVSAFFAKRADRALSHVNSGLII
jgi:hypothetical protein